jgi:predicted transcriptional regulator
MKNDGTLSLTTSKIRINILYTLCEKPCDLSHLKTIQKIKKSPEIIPRIKDLMRDGLIEYTSGECRITPLGRAYVKFLTPFRDFTSVLDESPFWKDHDISPIPEELLFRLNELKNCNTVQIERSSVFEPGALFMHYVGIAPEVSGLASSFFPGWIPKFLEKSREGIPIEIVITPEIYLKLKNEYSSILDEWLNSKNFSIYISEINATCTITPEFTCLLLNLKDGGTFDHSNVLVSKDDPLAIKWTKDLYNYYKLNAVKAEPEISTSSTVINASPSRIVLENLLCVSL